MRKLRPSFQSRKDTSSSVIFVTLIGINSPHILRHKSITSYLRGHRDTLVFWRRVSSRIPGKCGPIAAVVHWRGQISAQLPRVEATVTRSQTRVDMAPARFDGCALGALGTRPIA